MGRKNRNANKGNRSPSSKSSSLCSPAGSSASSGIASEMSLRTRSVVHSCSPDPSGTMVPHKLGANLAQNHTAFTTKGSVLHESLTHHELAQEHLQENSSPQNNSYSQRGKMWNTSQANGHIRAKSSNGSGDDNSCSPGSARSSEIFPCRKENITQEVFILLHFIIAMLCAQDAQHSILSRISSMRSTTLPLPQTWPMIAWLIGGVLCDVASWKAVLLLSQVATAVSFLILEETTNQEVLKLMALYLPLLQQTFIACQVGILCVGSLRERMHSLGRLTAVYHLISWLRKSVLQYIGHYMGPSCTSWSVLALSVVTLVIVLKTHRTTGPTGFRWRPAEYIVIMMCRSAITLLSASIPSLLPRLTPFLSNMELIYDPINWMLVLVQCLGLLMITPVASSANLKLATIILPPMYGILSQVSTSHFWTLGMILSGFGAVSIMQTLVVAFMSTNVAPKHLGLALGINLALHTFMRVVTQSLQSNLRTLCSDCGKFPFSVDEDRISCMKDKFILECLQEDTSYSSLIKIDVLFWQLCRVAQALFH